MIRPTDHILQPDPLPQFIEWPDAKARIRWALAWGLGIGAGIGFAAGAVLT